MGKIIFLFVSISLLIHNLAYSQDNLRNKADSLFELKHLDSAIFYYSIILESTELKTVSYFEVQNRICSSLIRAQKYDEAKRILKREIHWLREQPGSAFDAQLGDSYDHLAQTYRWLKQTDSADYYNNLALQLRTETFGYYSLPVARTFSKLGTVELQVKYNIDSAEYFLEKSVEIRDSIGIVDETLGILYYLLAKVKKLKSNPYEALLFAKAAFSTFLFVDVNTERLTATTLILIGEIQTDLNDLVEAEKTYRQAIDHRKKYFGDSDFYLADYYLKYSSIQRKLGNAEESDRFAKLSIDINQQNIIPDEDWLADAYEELSRLSFEEGQKLEARALAQTTLEIRMRLFGNHHPEVAKSYLLLSEVEPTNQVLFCDSALIALEVTINQSEQRLYQQILSRRARLKMNLYRSTNELKNGKNAFTDYLSVIRSFQKEIGSKNLRRTRFMQIGRYRELWSQALTICMELFQKTNETIYLHHFVELLAESKSSLLLLENQLSSIDYRLSRELLKLEDNLSYDTDLSDNESNNKMLSMSKEISKVRSSLRSKMTNPANRVVVDPCKLLIDIGVFDTVMFGAYIMTDTTLIIKRNLKPYQDDFESLIRFFASQPKMKISSFKEFARSSYSISRLLMLDTLQNVSSITVFPDGPFSLIPIESLILSLPEKTNVIDYRSLSYAIKEFEINYFHSFDIYRSSSSHGTYTMKNLLGMSFSDQISTNRFGIVELRGADQEIDYLSQNLRGEFFWHTDANLLNLKTHLPKSDALHLSTHADWIPEISNSSFLLLKNDQNQIDTLFTSDLATLPQMPPFVFLSACKTGNGEVIVGEGTNSLTREFISLGSSSVISSLWSIDDRSSEDLIIAFYSNLKELGGVNRSLREAKLDYLRKSDEIESDPRNWAALISYGNITLRQENRYNFQILAIGFFLILGVLMYRFRG